MILVLTALYNNVGGRSYRKEKEYIATPLIIDR